jgi:hypothetical protein
VSAKSLLGLASILGHAADQAPGRLHGHETTREAGAEGINYQHKPYLEPDGARPPTPSLDCGPIQRRVRRAFFAMGKAVLSTRELVVWAYSRGRGTEHDKRRTVRRVCARYCIRVGRGAGVGRPTLWRLRNSGEK